MADRLSVTGITSVRPDRRNDVVEIDCSAGQSPVKIDFHRGVLGTLIISLLQSARAFPGDSEEFLSQPLQLTGVGVVSFEDGSFGLELSLDEGIRLFVAVPNDTLSLLQRCVNAVGALGHAMSEERAGATTH
jgi:hypothetical protein